MNDIVTVENVKGYVGENGMIYLNVEDVARGLGFTHKETKNGVEYSTIRWSTVNNYLADFGFANKLAKGDFIPENIFYLLAMKASNEAAKTFQLKIANEILPTIRKHGMYINPHAPINPNFLRKMADEIEERDKKIALLQPKADYCDAVLHSEELLTATQIAADFDRSAVWLNEKLRGFGVLSKKGRGHILRAKYFDKGFAKNETTRLKNGMVKTEMRWTHEGRKFIHELFRNNDIKPVHEITPGMWGD